MNREKRYQLIIFVLLLLFIVFSVFVGLWFGEVYLILLLLIAVLGSAFVFIELYLRAMRNIDNKGRESRGLKSYIQNKFQENANTFNKKFDEQKKIYEEIVDFFENLLNYLEESKKETGQITEKMNEKFEGINDRINEKFEGINDRINEKFDELKELQNKIAVLNQQMMEYQKDQTNFLKSKIDKLKNGSKSRKRK